MYTILCGKVAKFLMGGGYVFWSARLLYLTLTIQTHASFRPVQRFLMQRFHLTTWSAPINSNYYNNSETNITLHLTRTKPEFQFNSTCRGIFRISVRRVRGAVGVKISGVGCSGLGPFPENDFGCIFPPFLTGRKHVQSIKAFEHGFYGSVAKRTLQKQCKTHGRTIATPPPEYATVHVHTIRCI